MRKRHSKIDDLPTGLRKAVDDMLLSTPRGGKGRTLATTKAFLAERGVDCSMSGLKRRREYLDGLAAMDGEKAAQLRELSAQYRSGADPALLAKQIIATDLVAWLAGQDGTTFAAETNPVRAMDALSKLIRAGAAVDAGKLAREKHEIAEAAKSEQQKADSEKFDRETKDLGVTQDKLDDIRKRIFGIAD